MKSGLRHRDEVRRRSRLLATILLATLAGGGCHAVEIEKPLPWFEIRKVHYPGLGGFGSGSTQQTLFVRQYGFWWTPVDCLGGEVLDRETVAVFCTDSFHSGIALIKEGETKPVPACGSYAAYAQILPDKTAVDCFDVLAGNAPVVPTKLRYWRIDLRRRTLLDHTLVVDERGRAFVGPTARFYDDRNRGYFVAEAEDFRAEPDCELLSVEAGGLVRVVAAPDLNRTACSDVATWSERSGRALRTP